MKKGRKIAAIGLMIVLAVGTMTGCGKTKDTGKIEVELVSYKQEAVKLFEQFEKEFNASQDKIHLTIDSPNEAMTVLKTRFIREDNPDIIAIGGDINYSNFVDSDMLMDISDFDGFKDIKQAYLDIDKALEFVPKEGRYALPYGANASGILYNKDIFEEHGWTIPTTWSEFTALCDEMQKAGISPLTFGYKDVWTCLAPWNAIAVDLAPADVCQQVNRGETTFSKEYPDVAQKMLDILQYGPEDPFAYNYNDACTSFANGESAMYVIGSYAVLQVKSVNPDMNLDSFVFPAADKEEDNALNSGVDLQFCVMEDCENKEAVYEVLRFLMKDENVQTYIEQQNSVPCKEGEFELASTMEGMKGYIAEGRMHDYQDHYYPGEMSVDAQIQTFLMKKDVDAFLKKFDKDWVRYNRDIIRKIEEYDASH